MTANSGPHRSRRGTDGPTGRGRGSTGGADARTRRSVLALTGAGLAASLAGCLGSFDDGNQQVGTPDGSAATTAGDGDGGDGDATETTEEPPAELTPITYRGRFDRVGLAPAVNDAGIAMGSWEAQGLDVEYVTASGAMAAAKSVAAGNDDFGNGGIAAVLKLIENGAPLVVIGQIADPMAGIVSLEERGIEAWSDLEGKVVGKFPFGSTGPVAEAAMRKAGVDPAAVTFQNVQPGAALKLLLDGKLDAMIKYFPQMQARLEHRGEASNVLKTSDVLGHLDVSLYTRTDVVADHPDRVDRFVTGWLGAFQLWATRLDDVIELYRPLAVGNFDEELERKTVGPLYASHVPSKDVGLAHGKGWTPPEQLERTLAVFESAGMLDGSLAPEDVYTNRFIEANQELAIETARTLYDALEDYDVGPNHV